MPADPTTRPRPRRQRRVLALLAALTALAAVVLPSSGAAAGPPAAPTNAIDLTVTGLVLPPGAAGSPDVLVSADTDFAVTVSFLAGPYSQRTATDVLITASDGRRLKIVTVPAGQSSATEGGLRLPAANGITLTAQAVGRKAASDLAPDTTRPFDVVLTAKNVTITEDKRRTSLFLNADGLPEPCLATPERQTCVDVLLPNGVDSDVFFSRGLCTTSTGCRDLGGSVLQVLADLTRVAKDGTQEPLYTPEAPATLVVKCDKSRCGGGAISDNRLYVNLAPAGALAASPACSAKGFMSGPLGHCVDYVQSKRDGSGDTYLYLLITEDVRMSF